MTSFVETPVGDAASSLGGFRRLPTFISVLLLQTVLAGFFQASHADERNPPSDHSPSVFWASQPVGPDETVLAATGNTDQATTVQISRLADDSPGEPGTEAVVTSWLDAEVLQSSATSVKFVVPARLSRGVYAIRMHSGTATSAISLLNAPEIWFIEGDLGEGAAPGGWLQVHGINIAGRGTDAQLALVKDGHVAAMLHAKGYGTGYEARFSVPVSVHPGQYEVYIHNGLGGRGAWSRYRTFIESPIEAVRIDAPDPWPTETVDVSKQVGKNDDERMQSAIRNVTERGGGLIFVPAGTYSLSRQIALPDRSILRGAGKGKTILKWTTPPAGDPISVQQGSLVVGVPLKRGKPDQGRFVLEDLSIVASPDFVAYAVESAFSSGRGGISRCAISVPNIGVFDNKKGRQPTAVFLRQRSNFEIVDSDLDAANDLFARDGVSHLRVENNRLNWTESNIILSGRSHGFIITGNTFNLRGNADRNGWTAVASRQKGTTPNPGFWFTAFYGTSYPGGAMSGPYVRDLYFARNRSTRDEAEIPPAYVGFTFDGGEGIYLGKIATSNGTALRLQGATLQPSGGGTYDWSGAIVQIVDGTGAGQWRYVAHAASGASEIELDRPWDVPPDGTSTVNVVNLQGRVLMIENDFAQEQTNQQYFFSNDVIKAGNRYGVDGTVASDLSWMGRHYHGLFTGWHLEVLDNVVNQGRGFTFKSSTTSPYDEYAGSVSAYQVFRNNYGKDGAPVFLSITSKSGRASDILVENNKTQSVDFGAKSSDRVDLRSALLRRNPGANSSTPGAVPPKDASLLRVIP
jgi:hypothetical protein